MVLLLCICLAVAATPRTAFDIEFEQRCLSSVERARICLIVTRDIIDDGMVPLTECVYHHILKDIHAIGVRFPVLKADVVSLIYHLANKSDGYSVWWDDKGPQCSE
jgi:hypothetical protein